jgi:hypothetical protein
MSKSLFENFKVLVLESGDLSHRDISKLIAVLDRHGVSYEVRPIEQHIEEHEFLSSGFTHIISNSVMFELYSFAQEKLIPVATAEFIYATVEKGKQQPIRPYSPDPKHVLKEVHVCCGGLPVSDKEAIYGGVRALGGTFSETLNKYVTHVISMNPDEDIVIAVESLKQFKIKPVIPLWIDHCLKLRKKLDETPYLLTHEPVEEQTKKILQVDVVRFNKDLIISQKTFLEGKQFYLGKDLDLTHSARELVSSLIKNSGGTVVNSLNDAKFYVGLFRDGEEYIGASRSKLYVGNLNWIYWMVEHQKWISPYLKLLHYPYVRGGMPSMQNFTIAASNYSGDARYYIKNLIIALGAKFTSNLTPKNTHLVTSKGAGKKFQAAHNWKLNIVNHLWLEECYSNWKLEPITHPRYSVNISGKVRLEDIVGETSLDIDVLKQFYESCHFPSTTHMVGDSEDEPELALKKILNSTDEALETVDCSSKFKDQENSEILQSIKSQNGESQDLTKTTPRVLSPQRPNESNTRTPVALKRLPDSSSPVVRSSSRKAKDKAAAKLHADMEDLNLFQKQSRGAEILLPEEIGERKRKREEYPEDRDTKVEQLDADEAPVKKTKGATKSVSTRYNIIAIATGWEVDFNRADNQLLQSLGITIHKELKKGINCIIAPKLMRTEKFLIGLSYGLKCIISPDFIKNVIKLSKSGKDSSLLPDPLEFSIDVTNSKSVKELTSLSLLELTHRCQEFSKNGNGLFNHTSFSITTKLPGGASTVQKILKSHGCTDVKVIKTIKDMKSKNVFSKSKDGVTVLISNEKGINEQFRSLCEEEGLKGKIVEWDWVISSLFTMDVGSKDHILFEN